VGGALNRDHDPEQLRRARGGAMGGAGDSGARIGVGGDIQQQRAERPISGRDRGVPDIGIQPEFAAGMRVQRNCSTEAEYGGERREVTERVGAGQEGSRFSERCHGAMIAPSSG
jgi:hypothetical protein